MVTRHTPGVVYNGDSAKIPAVGMCSGIPLAPVVPRLRLPVLGLTSKGEHEPGFTLAKYLGRPP